MEKLARPRDPNASADAAFRLYESYWPKVSAGESAGSEADT
jgi:hypothetical protein